MLIQPRASLLKLFGKKGVEMAVSGNMPEELPFSRSLFETQIDAFLHGTGNSLSPEKSAA